MALYVVCILLELWFEFIPHTMYAFDIVWDIRSNFQFYPQIADMVANASTEAVAVVFGFHHIPGATQ